MPDSDLPPAPDLSRSPASRRAFLGRAALIGMAIPGAGAALLSCTDERKAAPPAHAPAQDGAHPLPPLAHSNDDAAPAGTGVSAYHRYDPALPPLSTRRHVEVEMTVREVEVNLSHDVRVPAWTFDGTVPGPIVRVRQGDTVDFTLINAGAIPHSMDFHAAQINPKVAFRPVMPKQSLSFSFTPKYAGAFMYHCGTQPVLMHIGSGMFGAIIVDPPSPLPPAREFVLVHSEHYVRRDAAGNTRYDYQQMLGTLPDYVTFNGVTNQYMDAPLRVKRGERVRFYVVNAGPSHPCAFHIVGEQFDTVYLGSPPGNAIRGVQTFGVAPGGGMIFELVCDVAGEFPFVNHAFGHGQKGAIGILIVE
jgi:nitrite reductase (NO-forming)